jgi:serine protease Do
LLLKFIRAGAAALILFTCAGAEAKPAPDGFAALVKKLSPAVVNIATVRSAQAQTDAEDVTGNGTRSLGSGFVVDPAGYIVTSNHVIEGANEIYVSFADGSRRAASVQGRDAKTDISLLKVKAAAPLPSTEFGDSSAAEAGDWVLAIGNPFGLGGSVSAGIISARNRQLDAELYDDFIQTDAAINRGNSGGPLFDMEGKVVGLNSALMSPTGNSIGIGFAIPSNTVKTIVAQLKQFGRVRRGWIGANVQDLTPELAAGFALASRRGALVGHVTSGGPADAAGLKPGDIITKIDASDISDTRAMQRLIVEAPIGGTLTIAAVRKGQAKTFQVRVGKRTETAAPSKVVVPASASEGIAGLGFDVGQRDENVVVTTVAPGSIAALAGFAPGDAVVEIAQQRVRSVPDFDLKLAALRAKGTVALFTLKRGGDIAFKALTFPKGKVDKPLKTAAR